MISHPHFAVYLVQHPLLESAHDSLAQLELAPPLVIYDVIALQVGYDSSQGSYEGFACASVPKAGQIAQVYEAGGFLLHHMDELVSHCTSFNGFTAYVFDHFGLVVGQASADN